MTKRQTLSTFTPQLKAADGATITQGTEASTSAGSKTYPKVSVYLTAEEVRALKLLSVDTGKRVSDICAVAIREWMQKNGHARTHNA